MNRDGYYTRVTRCEDGKFRWVYEFDMLKNPVILFTVWKVLWIAFAAVFAFMLVLDIIEGSDFGGLFELAKMLVLLCLVLSAIGFVAYLIVSAQYGRKYIVLFEMDENGVIHKQMGSQFDRASAMGWFTAMTGVLTGNPAAIGMGINAATRNSLSTEFKKVRKIKSSRRFNTIYLKAPFSNNQVYVADEDFDIVLEYIRDRVEQSRY